MSSNKRIKRVCPICDKEFIAKQVNTKFCSDMCRRRRLYTDYVETKADEYQGRKINVSEPKPSKFRLTGIQSSSFPTQPEDPKELIKANELASVTGLSISTIFRIIKDPAFPQVKIGKLLRFHKESAISFIIKKYGLANSNRLESG